MLQLGSLLVELDWSLRAMAVAELLALREQIPAEEARDHSGETAAYDPGDRSLVNTLRTLRKCMRNLHKLSASGDGVFHQLSRALVQRHNNQTDKRARYRRKNPDRRPLGEPTVRKLTQSERNQLDERRESTAA